MSQNNLQERRKASRSSRPLAPLLLALGGLLILLAIFAAGGGLNRSQSASGGPRLQVDQERVDFGEVKMGDPVSATFKLTNRGDRALRFTKEPYISVVEGC
jgi:hypothetical protein